MYYLVRGANMLNSDPAGLPFVWKFEVRVHSQDGLGFLQALLENHISLASY